MPLNHQPRKTPMTPFLHTITEPGQATDVGCDPGLAIPTPKTVQNHPFRAVYEALIGNDPQSMTGCSASCGAVFSYALNNKGKIRRGVNLGSAEHAAALAGAALWRAENPSLGKGGPGRGQGRKAADGQTDFARMSVNVRPDQHEEFKKLGGSLWLRAQIDAQRKDIAKA